MLSPATRPAAAVMANCSVRRGQRRPTNQVSTAPEAIMPDTEAGRMKDSPSAAALGK